MTTDVIIPFPDDLVYNDLVENNIPPSDVPLVTPSCNSPEDSDENDVNTSDSTWTAAAGKEFRSSFLFQSSCYLPDDDGTESETSYTQHTSTTTTLDYPLGLLHRDEAYPNRQQQPSSLHESISATSISSILKLSASNTENIQPPRRVMFYDDDNDNLNTMNSNIDLLVNHSDSGGGRRDDDIDEEKSSWVGFNRIEVPLNHKFHSLPQIPSIKTTTATTSTSTIVDSYHSHELQSPLDHLQQYGDEEDCRVIASEFQYNTNKDDSRKRKRCQRICIFTILFLVFGSMAVALTCGMTQCGRDIRQELSSSNSSPTNVSSPTVSGNDSLSPTMTPSANYPPQSEQTSPTLFTQTIITMPPSSISPTFTHETIAIESTEQLYSAVDAYILYRYNKTIVNSDEYDYYSTPIGLWDVSRITNFTSIFSMLRNPMMQHNFNEDIGLWDTSNAVTMEQMFYGAEKWVNGNITHWITSNVTNMREMFARASNFNDDISLWDVSKVTTMEGMFRNTNNFKGNLKRWDTSSVLSMSKMFLNCDAFSGYGVDTWDTSRVVDMKDMFRYTPTFNGDVSSWNVSRVITMRGMFRQAVAFNSDLSQWDLRSVTDISQMFMHAVRFNADISAWNTSSLTNASEAFFGAISFNGDISAWNVRKVTDLTKMFAGAISFSKDLCPWVKMLPPSDKIMTITRSMFVATNCPVTTFPLLTDDYGSTFCYPCDNAIPNNSTSVKVTPGNIFEFEYAPILTQDELQQAVDEYVQNSTNSSNVAAKYGHPISNWNVSLVTNFSNLFDTHRNPKLVTFIEDLDGWDTSSAIAMSRMFAGASWFNGNISTWSTSRVTTMEGMFLDAFTFNGDVSQWNTSSCTTMASMFAGADQFNGNLTFFDTSNVIDMSDMFSSAISFEGIGLERWNTSAVVNMNAMFEQTFSFTADVLSSWDVSRVVDMSAMFQQSSFNGIISDWNVTNVVLLNSMFGGAGAFNQDLSPWNVANAVNFNGMFAGAKGFNQNLCSWGPRIDATSKDVYVAGMFLSSACTNSSDPKVGGNIPVASMCRDCNET